MAVKTFHLDDGRKFRLGRKAPVVHYPVLKFSNYLEKVPGLPTQPKVADYTEKAQTALSQMYLNDALGDCVIAGVSHAEGVITGNANVPLLYTDAQVKALYSAACGYVDGNEATDQGCDVQTVLAYWQNHGHPAGSEHKIVGYLAVDGANTNECQLALWLFENLIFGVGLPDGWVNPMPNASGFTWDVAGNADPNNGHCFAAFGYDASSFKISTWGMLGNLTNAALNKYTVASAGGELYVVISEEQLNSATKKAPNGLDWTSLVDDFNALGGKVVVPPSPTPNTSPNTAPSQPIPGSKAWMESNLSPAAYATYKAAFSHPVKSAVPGTPGWYLSHMSAASYANLVTSYVKEEGGTWTNVQSKFEEFITFLKAEYAKII